MPYTGELQRNSPFSFQTPAVFSPWVDGLLMELRMRLRGKGHNAASVRRIAKLLEGHLHAVSLFALDNPMSRAALAKRCSSNEVKAAFLIADTPAKVRECMFDYDLKYGQNFTAPHLFDTPCGFYDVEPFAKCAVLALWKFASVKEAFEISGATHLTVSLALEGVTCANLAVALDEGDKDLAREIHNMCQTTARAIDETIETKKRESKAVRSPAAKAASVKLWGKYKRRALELASSEPFKSYSKAADHIQPILGNEPGLYRHANHRKICDWLKEMGWRPAKIKR